MRGTATTTRMMIILRRERKTEKGQAEERERESLRRLFFLSQYTSVIPAAWAAAQCLWRRSLRGGHFVWQSSTTPTPGPTSTRTHVSISPRGQTGLLLSHDVSDDATKLRRRAWPEHNRLMRDPAGVCGGPLLLVDGDPHQDRAEHPYSTHTSRSASGAGLLQQPRSRARGFCDSFWGGREGPLPLGSTFSVPHVHCHTAAKLPPTLHFNSLRERRKGARPGSVGLGGASRHPEEHLHLALSTLPSTLVAATDYCALVPRQPSRLSFPRSPLDSAKKVPFSNGSLSLGYHWA